MSYISYIIYVRKLFDSFHRISIMQEKKNKTLNCFSIYDFDFSILIFGIVLLTYYLLTYEEDFWFLFSL